VQAAKSADGAVGGDAQTASGRAQRQAGLSPPDHFKYASSSVRASTSLPGMRWP
jgi:hypothetical protein